MKNTHLNTYVKHVLVILYIFVSVYPVGKTCIQKNLWALCEWYWIAGLSANSKHLWVKPHKFIILQTFFFQGIIADINNLMN